MRMPRKGLTSAGTVRRHRGFQLAAAGLAVWVGGEAQAIVINDSAGPAAAIAAGTPYAGVAAIDLGLSFCTGALITDRHILTAQHCTFGISAALMSASFDLDNDGTAEVTRNVSAVTEFDGTDNLLDGTDIAILTLSAPVTNIEPFAFLDANPTGVVAQTVGYGLNGVGSVGHQFTFDGLRWAGENVIDSYGAGRGNGGFAFSGTDNIFNTDFDDGSAFNNTLSPFVVSDADPLVLEATTGPGDSGGPLLVNNLIVGVLSGGTTNTSVYGDISWWTGTSIYRDFIELNAPGATFIIPEPGTLTCFGLLLGSIVTRRRRAVA